MKKFFSIVFLMPCLLMACSGNTPVAQPPTMTPVPPTISTQPPVTETSTPAPATQTPIAPLPTNSPDCTDSAAFVGDVTVPDATYFDPGQSFIKTWRVQNTGTCTWNSQYSLVFVSGNQMGAPNSTPLSETRPGDMLDISVDMTAPSDAKIYRANFEIHNPSGARLTIDQNTKVWVIIGVNAVAASSGGGSGGGSTSANGSNSVTNTPSGSGLLVSTCAFTADSSRANDVITAINAYRAQNGLPPYNVNAQLSLAAQSHSEDMACNGLFTHGGSDGSTPISRIAAAGYSASSVSENVYGSYPPRTGQGAVTWWATDQTDPNHNLNLLSSKYKDIGVGYAFFNNFGYYVVDFAAP